MEYNVVRLVARGDDWRMRTGILSCDLAPEEVENAMRARAIQTTDHRITWDVPIEDDIGDGWQYVDWSFCLTN